MTATPMSESHAQGRLTRCAGSLLSLLFVLRRNRDLDGFTDLRLTVDRLFHEFRNQARHEGISTEAINDASYALAASFDEVLLSTDWAGKEAWQRESLAKQYCNDEFVGDGFYDKLATIRRTIAPDPEVVEIFYYCLISGFQGRMIESPQQRKDLTNELAHDIAGEVQVLAPNGLPVPEGGKLQPIKRFPWPIVVLASIFIPILIWLLSWNALDRHAKNIVQALGGN